MRKESSSSGTTWVRRLIAVLLLCIGGLMRIDFASASPPRAAPDSGTENRARLVKPSERRSVQIWWGLGGPLGQAFEKQVARFNDSQEAIVVEVRMLPGYGGVYGELTKAFQTGELPDVAIVEIHQIFWLRTEGFYKEHPAFETAIEQLKFAREAPQMPQWSAAYSIIGEAMNSIVGNDAPALETLKAAEIKVNALLSPDGNSKP